MSITTTTEPKVIDDYFAMWLETDADARATQVAAVFTEDGRHVDPNADAKGHDGLAAMITAVHDQFPGLGMRRTSAIDQHNDQLRFAWDLLDAEGTTILSGLDVVQLAADGRLAQVAGFWGDLPTA